MGKKGLQCYSQSLCLLEKELVPWLLDVGRLLLGIRNENSGYLVPVYLSEITPKNLRGRFTTGVQANSELDKIQVTVGREEFETALRSLRGKKANVFEEAAYCNWAEGTLTPAGGNAYAYYSGVIFTTAGLSKYVGLSTLAVVKVSSAGLCVGSFLTGMSFLLQDHPLWSEGTQILGLISIWVYMGSYQVGMEGIPWIIVAEVNLL
ncbi:hypothetical protein GOBAR_DD22150 [Gossypium barbadense]|nr:hypothetical protein GOBAR_DD22150 [Gossypium barbadense]